MITTPLNNRTMKAIRGNFGNNEDEAVELTRRALSTGSTRDRLAAEHAISLVESDRKSHFTSNLTENLRDNLRESREEINFSEKSEKKIFNGCIKDGDTLSDMFDNKCRCEKCNSRRSYNVGGAYRC